MNGIVGLDLVAAGDPLVSELAIIRGFLDEVELNLGRREEKSGGIGFLNLGAETKAHFWDDKAWPAGTWVRYILDSYSCVWMKHLKLLYT